MSTRTLVIKETSYTVPRYIHRYIDGSWMLRFLGINKVWQDASYNGTRAALNEAIKYLHALVSGCETTIEDSMRCEITYEENEGYIAHFPSFLKSVNKLKIDVEKQALVSRSKSFNIKEVGARVALGETTYQQCLLHWKNMVFKSSNVWPADLRNLLIKGCETQQLALFEV